MNSTILILSVLGHLMASRSSMEPIDTATFSWDLSCFEGYNLAESFIERCVKSNDIPSLKQSVQVYKEQDLDFDLFLKASESACDYENVEVLDFILNEFPDYSLPIATFKKGFSSNEPRIFDLCCSFVRKGYGNAIPLRIILGKSLEQGDPSLIEKYLLEASTIEDDMIIAYEERILEGDIVFVEAFEKTSFILTDYFDSTQPTVDMILERRNKRERIRQTIISDSVESFEKVQTQIERCFIEKTFEEIIDNDAVKILEFIFVLGSNDLQYHLFKLCNIVTYVRRAVKASKLQCSLVFIKFAIDQNRSIFGLPKWLCKQPVEFAKEIFKHLAKCNYMIHRSSFRHTVEKGPEALSICVLKLFPNDAHFSFAIKSLRKLAQSRRFEVIRYLFNLLRNSWKSSYLRIKMIEEMYCLEPVMTDDEELLDLWTRCVDPRLAAEFDGASADVVFETIRERYSQCSAAIFDFRTSALGGGLVSDEIINLFLRTSGSLDELLFQAIEADNPLALAQVLAKGANPFSHDLIVKRHLIERLNDSSGYSNSQVMKSIIIKAQIEYIFGINSIVTFLTACSADEDGLVGSMYGMKDLSFEILQILIESYLSDYRSQFPSVFI